MRPPSPSGNRPPDAPESRASEALTVCWTLTATTTLLCDLGALGARWLAPVNVPRGNAHLLANFLLFAACLVGALNLALLPFVYQVRRVPPPRPIVVFAVLVSAAPLIAVAWALSWP